MRRGRADHPQPRPLSDRPGVGDASTCRKRSARSRACSARRPPATGRCRVGPCGAVLPPHRLATPVAACSRTQAPATTSSPTRATWARRRRGSADRSSRSAPTKDSPRPGGRTHARRARSSPRAASGGSRPRPTTPRAPGPRRRAAGRTTCGSSRESGTSRANVGACPAGRPGSSSASVLPASTVAPRACPPPAPPGLTHSVLRCGRRPPGRRTATVGRPRPHASRLRARPASRRGAGPRPRRRRRRRRRPPHPRPRCAAGPSA